MSKSSLKHKTKFRKQSPYQEFKIGDLVMIREQRTKNQPREIFIVKTLPTDDQKYILIRKLTNSLRPRLYKALAEELIHASEQLKKNATDSIPNETLTTRPKFERKAAAIAKNNLKKMVHTVLTKKTLFRHGWEQDDQDFSIDVAPSIVFSHNIHQEEPTSDSTSPTITPTPSPKQSVDSSTHITSEEEEMTWDTSPEQYCLTTKNSVDAWTPPPFVPQQISATIPQAFPRERLDAFSHQPLTRRNAFRRPPSALPFHSPQPSSRPVSSSRIPVPISPSQVDPTMVSDLSHVLPNLGMPPNAPRRSSCIRTQPNYLGTSNTGDKGTGDGENKEIPRKR